MKMCQYVSTITVTEIANANFWKYHQYVTELTETCLPISDSESLQRTGKLMDLIELPNIVRSLFVMVSETTRETGNLRKYAQNITAILDC